MENKNIKEIDRAISIGDTGAILVTEENELPMLEDHLAWNTLPGEQAVLIDFRQYTADQINAGWCWGKIGQVIEQPETVTELDLSSKTVSMLLVGPVNFLYENPKVKTYADIWRIIRKAIAVSTSTNCKIFFFTLSGKILK
jgi:hypothetical protein